jgi:hypothetical protein
MRRSGLVVLRGTGRGICCNGRKRAGGDGQQMDNYNLRERFAADFAADAANDNLLLSVRLCREESTGIGKPPRSHHIQRQRRGSGVRMPAAA